MSTRRAIVGVVVGESPLSVWALPSVVRLQRQLHRAGAPAGNAGAGNSGHARSTDSTGSAAAAMRHVLLRADWVYDDAIVRGLAASDAEVALRAPGGDIVGLNVAAADASAAAALLAEGRAPTSARELAPLEVADGYNDALRKREPPYLMALTAEALPAIERRVFGGAYKGVTDLVTLYAWPRPARYVTRLCAEAGISPNQVTSASLLLVFAAMWLFWHGHYGLGLVAAWAMTFLDTVDGKLARVTVASTPFGNVFDHGIDLVHPPFWWWAWLVGLPAVGLAIDRPGLALTAIVAGYVLQRVEEGAFIAAFGMDMHTWQRFDSLFRLVTARRNPNLLILTASALAGRPDLGIVAVAWWTVLCLAVHAVRLLQAAWARRRGPLRSWLAAPG